MAAPTINRPATLVYANNITGIAPQFLSALPMTTYSTGGGQATGTTGGNRYGVRIELPAAVNVSARKALSFQFQHYNMYPYLMATEGLYIIFFDASGNWSRFPLIYPNPSRPAWNTSSPSAEGYFEHYGGFNVTVPDFLIALDASPINTSGGGVNWAALKGFELGAVRNTTEPTKLLGLFAAYMAAIDGDYVTNGDATTPITMNYVGTKYRDGTYYNVSPFYLSRQLRKTSPIFYSPNGSIYSCTQSVTIGDGANAFRFDDTNFTVSFRPSYNNTLADQYPAIQLTPATKRFVKFNCAAGAYLKAPDASFAGHPCDGGDFDFYLLGSLPATFNMSNCVIANAGGVDANINGAVLSGWTFLNCAQVVYRAGVQFSGCTLRGNTYASSKGLTINAAPGNYSTIGIYFADNTAGHDVEITPSSTGVFDLTGLSVKAGQSLKIHNTTATPITVKLATGVTATTSGAGAITLDYPVALSTASITNLIANSRIRIYNQTTDTELFNDVVTDIAYSAEYTEGTGYSAGDIISVRVAWMSGTSAKLPAEYLAVATANGWSVLANQQDDMIYNANAIDGASVTEFIADYPNVHIDVNDPDGTTTPQRCYAWYLAGQMTADGIATYHGAITAEDAFNYRVNTNIVNLHGQNISANPLLVVGARIYRSDGLPLFVPGSGPVQMEYGRVYGLETGTSGLTPMESAALLAIPTNPVLTTDARLNNLDAAVSSRLPTSGYTSAPTVAQIRTELATELGRIDVSISSRLAAQDYVEPAPVANIANALLTAAQATPIHADTRRLNGATVVGNGSEADKWRGSGV